MPDTGVTGYWFIQMMQAWRFKQVWLRQAQVGCCRNLSRGTALHRLQWDGFQLHSLEWVYNKLLLVEFKKTEKRSDHAAQMNSGASIHD